jgi:hypothetical protein
VQKLTLGKRCPESPDKRRNEFLVSYGSSIQINATVTVTTMRDDDKAQTMVSKAREASDEDAVREGTGSLADVLFPAKPPALTGVRVLRRFGIEDQRKIRRLEKSIVFGRKQTHR